jgi:thioredoxin reductase
MSMTNATLPVAVIGAGPTGLAAAVHLLDRGEVPIVFEVGDAVGHSIRQWRHVSMFSPWEFNTDKAAAARLGAAGWQHPPQHAIPTGAELVERYLEPLASLPALRACIHLGAEVVGVTRKGYDKVRTAGRADRPFVLRVADAAGSERLVEAKAVIDASGTWTTPNPAGADGLPAIGERAAAARIVHGIPDIAGAFRQRYAGRSVAVVGSGHSALNAVIELAALQREVPDTRILWVMRKENVEAAFGGAEADALPARGALGVQARQLVASGAARVLAPFGITRIEPSPDDTLVIIGERHGVEERIAADQIIVATGFRPDLSFLREIRLTLDPWLESSGEIGPLIDPNLHSCGTVRPHGAKELAHAEPGFFIAGIKSYGRAPTFLLATGYEQVRSIVAALTGDTVAAARVELELPETGVCFSQPAGPAAATCDTKTACCA